MTEDKQTQTIRDTLVRLLSRREHSIKELYFKLQLRGFTASQVAPQLNRLTELDLQSDRRFAESFVRQRIAKGQGEQRIRNELRERDVSDEYIRLALLEADTDWFELAKSVHDRKFGQADNILKQKQKQQHQRYLQYRGFTAEQIRYACPCQYQAQRFGKSI
ncbi:regulatory protein RecX [Neptunicella sp. SCSIO 80796]|uniref:regulatory protein RecX n=1 Tax=Neptunicella plasticusilytica TaxID=3117012 RepID=UPI003A4E12F8